MQPSKMCQMTMTSAYIARLNLEPRCCGLFSEVFRNPVCNSKTSLNTSPFENQIYSKLQVIVKEGSNNTKNLDFF